MNKIAQIIPAVRLKRSLNYFDYLIPDELAAQIKIGQLVEIPFRNQVVKGVVLNLQEKSDSKYALKTIIKIIDSLPYLAPWQLELIKFMAEYYFVSMAMVLKMMLPEIPKRKSERCKEMKIEFVSGPLMKIAVPDIVLSEKPLLLSYADWENKISVYSHIIKNNISQNKQTVIIVPELNNLEQIYKYLGEYNGSISVLLNDLSKNKFWQEWLKIKNGQSNIILGTRSAIFAPFKNLGTIIIDEEDNVNHKQEEPNPRYNAKTIALKIADLTGAKLIFSAMTPSLNSLFKVQTKQWDYWQIDQPKELPQITIIDRQEEFRKGNYSIFSEKLLQSLANNLSQKKPSFLFLNRKGSATLVTCQDCGYIAVCPTCKLPLTYYKKSEELHCHHCQYKTPNLLSCPQCKGTAIKLTGSGTEKAENEIKKEFPQGKIIVFDQEHAQSVNLMNADIIIGTQFALNYIDWSSIQTTGVLNADIGLYSADYRSLEVTFNLLTKLAYFLPDQNKDLICQTFSPDNYIFQTFKNNNLKRFYQKEMQERKTLKYPPFAKLVKIIYQSIDFNGGQEEINEVYQFIKAQIADNQNFIINPPLLAYTRQVRGRFRWQLAIKILQPGVNLDFLNQLPDSVIIDIDPENLN